MPSKRINFRVVNTSGEDELHPSQELNSDKQGPLNQGWLTQKFCLFPSELTIQFEKRINLKKVQLLSHQFLIASKIEFYIGDCPNDNVNYQAAKYTRLGYVELSPNVRTDFKARELKSVHVDAEGTFLKFVMHKNFVNRNNLYNQVGLIAINVIGNDFNEEMNNRSVDMDTVSLAAVKRPDYISPLDDLAFVMYQDPEISKIIRSLDKTKCECVIAERFDEAKRLKQAISELYKIGERLARYDLEKRQAIDDEDYEKAKMKKLQIQEYRSETYRQLRSNNLLEYVDENIWNNSNKNDSASGHNNNNGHNNELSVDTKLDIDDQQSQISTQEPYSPRSNRQSKRSNENNSYRTGMELEKPPTPYEDRVIPTLRHNSIAKSHKGDKTERETNIDTAINEEDPLASKDATTSSSEAVVPESGSEGPEQELYDPIDGTEEMTEREVREAALMNDILGKQIVTKLYSKNFQNREDAIAEVYNNLVIYKGEQVEESKALFRATAILVAKMSKDNVFSIFNNSLRLFHFLLNDFAQSHQGIGKPEMNYALEKCLPILLHRTGDTNARLRQRSHEYIVEMAVYPEIKPLNALPVYLTIPLKLHTAPRLALSQCEIIEELMRSLGIRDNGLNVDNISKFCSHALEHTSGEVRELTTRILIQLYRECGSVVRKYLPQDNEMNRRNKKYRILFDAFDEIDGKPVHAYEGSTTPRFNNQRNVKTPVKSKTPNPRSLSIDRKTPLSMADDSDFNPDNTCMFCNEVNDKFVKQGMEMHYWKSCPMLKQCNDCKQVIEVAVQTEHLLTECQFKNNYKKCPRCTEAINITNSHDNDHHFKQEKCKPLTDKKGNRCPLCHMDIGVGEEVWKDHLMSPTGCTKNNRVDAPSTTNPNSKKPPSKR